MSFHLLVIVLAHGAEHLLTECRTTALPPGAVTFIASAQRTRRAAQPGHPALDRSHLNSVLRAQDCAAITADLHADLEPLLPSLDTLNVLLPILSAAQEWGALSLIDTDALVTTINDLACGCRAAQDAAVRLQDARTEAGYVKVELDRS